jgi:16S rRNA (adenine1518-N6/adenine1519-N6)-dimethyltransferase
MKRSRRQVLGQHFLRDPGILKKMVNQINPLPDETIVEIGAGKGALTFLLLEKAGWVFAIEKDKNLVPELRKRNEKKLVVIEEDVLRISFESLVGRSSLPKLVGNLPYSISSSILLKAAAAKTLFSGCWFLLQKEVAERICSHPGTKKYAPLSVFFQNFYRTDILFTVPPSAFSPPPKVESAFLSLAPREKALFPLHNEDRFFRFLKTCFQHRRKKLINNLLGFDWDRNQLEEFLRSAGLEEKTRAEQVSLSQFVSLYERLFP